MSKTKEHPYTMSISLNVLRHLGIGLYSNVAAVVSEMVANAWDADAAEVSIKLDAPNGIIEVCDTGQGMSLEEVNARFLKVGYQKRSDVTVTPSGRDVMGRKGIGKLSSFSIARTVEVHTLKEGEAPAAFRMTREGLEAAATSATEVYHPEPIDPDVSALSDHGTRLVLSDLEKKLSWTGPYLRKRLARRFSIIGPAYGFDVSVDGRRISPADRDFHKKLEFLWYFGEEGEAMAETVGAIRSKRSVDGSVAVQVPGESEPEEYQASGWIGTVDRPESLDDVNNAIVLLSRGRLVHEDILPDFGEAGIYADYIVGEVNADFLDTDEQDDIVTSGRQSVKEDDPRYRALHEFIGATLKTVKNEWSHLRKKRSKERALSHPAVLRWYTRLGTDRRKSAEKLFAKIESLSLPDVHAKREMYKASMLAFEKLALKDMLSALDVIESQADFETLAHLMSGVDELEATHYYEVVKGRLGVIEQFKDLLPDALEKVLQKHIFDHLWLLHPSWERAASNQRIEESVTQEFSKVKLSEEEKSGRIDIRYRTAAGKHVVIELKKYDRKVHVSDLHRQLQKYRTALKKCLREKFPNEPDQVEIITILGSPPLPVEDDEANRKTLDAINARYITYDQLVLEAERSYAEYLEKEREVSELIEIIEGLDEDFAVEDAAA